jgi:hypothetical protein
VVEQLIPSYTHLITHFHNFPSCPPPLKAKREEFVVRVNKANHKNEESPAGISLTLLDFSREAPMWHEGGDQNSRTKITSPVFLALFMGALTFLFLFRLPLDSASLHNQ